MKEYLNQPNPKSQPRRMFLDHVGSGMVRGAIGLGEIAEMAGRDKDTNRGYQEIKQKLGGEVEQETPIFDTATGRVLRGATMGGQFATANNCR